MVGKIFLTLRFNGTVYPTSSPFVESSTSGEERNFFFSQLTRKERSRSRGLRGNFKLISTSDLCLPRKQRTFEILLSLLSFLPRFFFLLFWRSHRVSPFPLRLLSGKEKTFFVFYIRCAAFPGINRALASRREDQSFSDLSSRCLGLPSTSFHPPFLPLSRSCFTFAFSLTVSGRPSTIFGVRTKQRARKFGQ